MQSTRPKLSEEQKAQLKTCFELMDSDGSGAIDVTELADAFDLLGLNFTRAEIQARPPACALHAAIFVYPFSAIHNGFACADSLAPSLS